MITANDIINIVLPITKEDNRCGMKKAKKIRARADLVLLINDYREGKQVVLPDEVLNLINENSGYNSDYN